MMRHACLFHVIRSLLSQTGKAFCTLLVLQTTAVDEALNDTKALTQLAAPKLSGDETMCEGCVAPTGIGNVQHRYGP